MVTHWSDHVGQSVFSPVRWNILLKNECLCALLQIFTPLFFLFDVPHLLYSMMPYVSAGCLNESTMGPWDRAAAAFPPFRKSFKTSLEGCSPILTLCYCWMIKLSCWRLKSVFSVSFFFFFNKGSGNLLPVWWSLNLVSGEANDSILIMRPFLHSDMYQDRTVPVGFSRSCKAGLLHSNAEQWLIIL